MFNDKNNNNREFQKSLDPEHRRRVREDDRLRLRREDREHRLQAKRRAFANRQRRYNDDHNYDNNNPNNQNNNGNNGNDRGYNSTMNNNHSHFGSQRQQQDMQRRQEMLHKLPQYVQGCFTDHAATNFECCQRIRKLLSIERNPPIREVIDSGVVPRLVQFLRFHQFDKLQFEAAWALTNIASGNAEHTAAVIRNGAVPIFVDLLQSSSSEVSEQCIWALGNIAGDSPECRNLVLSHNALNNLLPLCSPNMLNNNNNNGQQIGLLRNATWTLSNFCRGKPQPDWQYVRQAITALTGLLQIDDTEILTDSCWAFSYLSDIDSNSGQEDQRIQAIVRSGALKQLIQLFDHPSDHVKHPALRTVGNIVTGCDNQTQEVINLGVLSKLAKLLESDKPSIKKESCWTISNITAGREDQIEAVIHANLIQGLVNILRHDKFEVKKEAAWAISNATSGGSDQQIRFLVNQGVIQPLCKFFERPQSNKTVMVALEGIENILAVGKRDEMSNNGVNKFARWVEECGGLTALEELQGNEKVPDEIFEKAAGIVKEYFEGKTDDDYSNRQNNNNNNNNDGNNNMFSFGYNGGNNINI